MTALDNVAFALDLAGTGHRGARREAADALERVGIAALAETPTERLSVGEQQRVAIARAITGDRPLLVADLKADQTNAAVIRFPTRPSDQQVATLRTALRADVVRGDRPVDVIAHNRTDDISVVSLRTTAEITRFAVTLGAVAVLALLVAQVALALAHRRDDEVLHVLGPGPPPWQPSPPPAASSSAPPARSSAPPSVSSARSPASAPTPPAAASAAPIPSFPFPSSFRWSRQPPWSRSRSCRA